MSGELAVVLSGGGAKGAFQVGFLDELIRVRQVKVDIVVGVSTGALQALGVAQNDIAKMVSVWSSLKANKDIYTTRQLGAVGAVFGADALYDASPLRKLIKSFLDETRLKKSGVRCCSAWSTSAPASSAPSTRPSPTSTRGSMPAARCRCFSIRWSPRRPTGPRNSGSTVGSGT
jgi:predicted acylesterase/phospholipase RssA